MDVLAVSSIFQDNKVLWASQWHRAEGSEGADLGEDSVSRRPV